MRMQSKKGFTLLEIIIVVIILGILASLALPRLFNTVGRSRASEALNQMTSIRGSMDRCRMQLGTYVGCTLTVAATTLDINNPNLVATRNFDYVASLQTATTYQLQATGRAPNFAATDFIRLTTAADGSVTKLGGGTLLGI